MRGVLLVPSPSPTLPPIYDGLDVDVASKVTWFHLNHDMASRRIYKAILLRRALHYTPSKSRNYFRGRGARVIPRYLIGVVRVLGSSVWCRWDSSSEHPAVLKNLVVVSLTPSRRVRSLGYTSNIFVFLTGAQRCVGWAAPAKLPVLARFLGVHADSIATQP